MLGVDPFKLITGLLVGLLVMLFSISYYAIEQLREDIDERDAIILRTSDTLSQYKSALEYQDAEVLRFEVNAKKAQEEVIKYRNKPPEIRYKKVYKYIERGSKVRERGTVDEECKNIQDVVSSLDGVVL